jgi:hypothetical protein
MLARHVERGGLPSTTVSTGAITSFERGDKSLGQLTLRRYEALSHGPDDIWPGKQIPLAGETGADLLPGPRLALTTSKGDSLSIAVDDPNLTLLAQIVVGDQLTQHRVSGEPPFEQPKAARAKAQIGERLGCYGAGASTCPGYDRANRQELGRYSYTKIAVAGIMGHNRERSNKRHVHRLALDPPHRARYTSDRTVWPAGTGCLS